MYLGTLCTLYSKSGGTYSEPLLPRLQVMSSGCYRLRSRITGKRRDTRNHQCFVLSGVSSYPRTGNALEVGSWPIPGSLLPLALHYSNSSSPLLPLILSLPFLTVLVRRNLGTRSLSPSLHENWVSFVGSFLNYIHFKP
ncbi:hypothetical protein F4814DRAFT_380489 [Daldinia grandis]|nr:hypothetical protein F4814DRAFT_380489 [Daldinia grandis]